MEIFTRTKALIGERGLKRLESSHILLCGCGGVGSYALEALVRAGIGKITVIDADKVAKSNLNRQLIATADTVGMLKTDAAEIRAKSINHDIDFTGIAKFIDRNNTYELLDRDADYIIDAIDFVPAKTALAEYSYRTGTPIISCLGTGNRLDATQFEICDIFKTSGCPLARKMRCELKKAGVIRLEVLYSKAPVIQPENEIYDGGKRTVGSISYVPSTAGLLLAQHVITRLLEENRN